MKMTPDEKAQIALRKEYNLHMKNATRPGAPAIEKAYYSQMASNVASYIDWNENTKKRKARRDEEEAT